MTTTAAPAKPVPVPDEASAPFFARRAAKAGSCCCAAARCGDVHVADRVSRRAGPAALRRPASRATWSGRRRAGRATLYSFVLMHQLYDEAFAADVPYNIAVVETDEGVRLTSQVVDCPNERARDRHGARRSRSSG